MMIKKDTAFFFSDKTYTLIIFKYKNIFFKIFFVKKRKKNYGKFTQPVFKFAKS